MPDPSSTQAVVGQLIGNYRLLGALGAGGMGVVYRAHDEKLDRVVALKFIGAELEHHGSIQKRFLQEARAASSLDHPNIGTIHGIEESPDGRTFIVMACYEGENLANRIKRGPLRPAEAAGMAIQIARGLSEAHASKIIHRDIKPSNIIVTTSGLVKIVDFGLARVVHSSSSTRTAGLTGTAAYMSPEQASGQPVDERTDIWALGVVLWEMLTGQLPFQADNVPALLFSIVNSAPASLADSVPDSLRPILYRALAKDREMRYPGVREMQAELERFQPVQDSVPTQAISKRELRRVIKSAAQPTSIRSRHNWSKAAMIVLALALVAITALIYRFRSSLYAPAPSHIAVLPLENIGKNSNNQALTDGLQESLTNRLSNLETGHNALWVVPSAELRRRKIADPAEAQRILGANLVVTGSVSRDATGLRLALQLIDPANMRQLGGEVLDDRAGDLAELQDRAVSTLAKWMKVSVSPVAREKAATARPAAYESYLKARGDLQRYDKPGYIDQAIAQLEEAVKSDPNFAIAWAALGEAYLAKYHVEQNPRWLDQATESCTRAARIDNQLAPVHIALGRVQTDTGKLDLAVQEFQRALDLNPRNSDALFGLALVYERQGRPAEAGKMYERAAALRPDYWEGYNRLGEFYIRQNRPPDAEAQFKRAVELTPDNWVGYVNLGVALQLQNKYDEAANALQKSIQLSPSYAAYSNLGNIYYRQLKPAQAAPLFEKALSLNDKDYRTWTNYALANRSLALKGDKAAAQKAASGYKHALELLQAKYEREPNNDDVNERLAIMDAFFGRRDEALRHLESARVLDTSNDGYNFVRAQVFELLGDRKQAIAALESALQSGLKSDVAKRNPEVQGVLTDPNFKYPQ